MDLRDYETESNAYAALSLKDLLDARDTYHVHLMEHPNVVATAVGRYRIRKEDSWPDGKGPGAHTRVLASVRSTTRRSARSGSCAT